jgi:2-methylisocitrate lyase-like PEP mutase family enzyme
MHAPLFANRKHAAAANTLTIRRRTPRNGRGTPPRDRAHQRQPLSYGRAFKQAIEHNGITALIGVHDVFSAGIAGRYGDGIFVSGFGFAASYYGLPDIGFIAWPDLVDFVRRVRHILPRHHILVDIDDGYCDPAVAVQVVKQMEAVGASAVKLEDQKRPRKCGHFDGKQVLPLEEYLEKLNMVLEARREMLVVARTDATDKAEILRRVAAFAATEADIILADGIKEIGLLRELKAAARGKPILFNQIAGGKSPHVSLTELAGAGANVVIYSTPCLFAAQTAIRNALQEVHDRDGRMPTAPEKGADFVGVPQCTALLMEHLDGLMPPAGVMFGQPGVAAAGAA